MKSYSSDKIRNVVVLGHSGSGKSTLVEALLKNAGIIKRLGRIEDGNTVSDYDPEEIKRSVSISSSIIPIEWENTKINFIDTPGYFDFVGEVRQALSVADAAIIVVNAKSGNEVGTEKAWEYVNKYKLPRLVLVNGMDDEEANFDDLVDKLRAIYGKSMAPFQVPYFSDEGKFIGFINAIKREAKEYIDDEFVESKMPEKKRERVEEVRSMLVEIAAESDDLLLEKYFKDEELTIDEIYDGLNKGILGGTVTPVLCSVATAVIGMDMLLNTLIKAFPSSFDVHPKAVGKNPLTDELVEFDNTETAPFSAFVFKTIADPYVGRLSIFKVCSGTLKKDFMAYNANKDQMEKLSHLYLLRGKEQIDVSELKSGDIGALAKLSNTSTGDSLCTKENPIVFGGIDFPESLHSMAIMPKGKGDEDKISSALSKLLEEDLTLKNFVNPETKQSIISGISEQQLDVLVNKLANKYKIEVLLEKPVIPFREMIKGKTTVQGKYKKQSGGHGQYGDVKIEFEPSGDLTKAYIFEEKVFGGSVPRQYFPAVEKGIQEAVESGILAGYPMVGLKVTLLDGSYHPVDSSEMAFKMATSIAFKEGIPQARPTLLEPIAKIAVTVPEDYTGDIMGDFNKRRGRILGMTPADGKQVIEAEIPLAELHGYGADLRSMTQSRGEYTYAFSKYEEMPQDVQDKIIAARKEENSR